MMNKKEILEELESEFIKLKRDLGFKTNLDDIDKIFFVRDAVLKEGFVSDNLSRQICSRIVDTYMNWIGYLQSLVMPNPHHLVNANESRMVSEDEKKEMMKMMSKAMAIISTNTYVGLTKDKKTESKFIDDSVEFWNVAFKPFAEKIMKKVNEGWKNMAK